MRSPPRTRSPWTQAELDELKARLGRGELVANIVRIFPHRTEASVRSYVTKMRKEMFRDQRSISDRRATTELHDAIKDLFQRVANDTGKEMAEVMADMLGPEPAPKAAGTQRPYLSPHAFGIATIGVAA